MSGEEGARVGDGIFMDMLHDRPGYRDAIVGGSAATQLIEEDERTGTHIVEDGGSLIHFDHESRLSRGDIVGSADASKNLVDITYAGTLCRHERSDLCHQCDESGLT